MKWGVGKSELEEYPSGICEHVRKREEKQGKADSESLWFRMKQFLGGEGGLM